MDGERHQELLDEIHQLYLDKNEDYGDSVHITFKQLGLTSAVSRLCDKTNRLITFCQKGKLNVRTEKIRDTLLDLANYAILTVMEIDEEESLRPKYKEIPVTQPEGKDCPTKPSAPRSAIYSKEDF